MTRTRGLAFAKVFEQLCSAANLSPADVARELDAADSVVSRWRTGQSVPGLANLECLAKLFNVERSTLQRLAWGSSSDNPTPARESISPELLALVDTERAMMLEELGSVPEAYWAAILAAQRTARRFALDVTRAALESAEPKPPIGNPQIRELAPRRRRKPQDRHGGDGPQSEPLARLLPVALAG